MKRGMQWNVGGLPPVATHITSVAAHDPVQGAAHSPMGPEVAAQMQLSHSAWWVHEQP